MAAPTTAELLDQVRQAISDLLTTGVAGYGDDGQTYTMLDLGRLEALEEKLTRRVAAESGGSFRLAVPLRRQ